jgi:hypothetical protein
MRKVVAARKKEEKRLRRVNQGRRSECCSASSDCATCKTKVLVTMSVYVHPLSPLA